MTRPEFNVSHRMPRGSGDRCDFCGSVRVLKLYACRNFMWEGQNVFGANKVSGRWASCYPCSELIDNNQMGRLSLRVVREMAKRKGINEEQLALLNKTVRVLHKSFALHIVKGEVLTIIRPTYVRMPATP